VVLVDRAWPGWAVVVRRGLVQAIFAVVVTPWMFRLVQWERRMLRLA